MTVEEPQNHDPARVPRAGGGTAAPGSGGARPASADPSLLPSDSGNNGARWVAGFAIVGLFTAAIVGLWTWKVSSNPPAAHTSAVTSDVEAQAAGAGSSRPSSTFADGATPSVGKLPSSPLTGQSSDRGPAAGATVSLSEKDPYLPPNAWGGSGAPTGPTATVLAEPASPQPLRPSRPGSNGAGGWPAVPPTFPGVPGITLPRPTELVPPTTVRPPLPTATFTPPAPSETPGETGVPPLSSPTASPSSGSSAPASPESTPTGGTEPSAEPAASATRQLAPAEQTTSPAGLRSGATEPTDTTG